MLVVVVVVHIIVHMVGVVAAAQMQTTTLRVTVSPELLTQAAVVGVDTLVVVMALAALVGLVLYGYVILIRFQLRQRLARQHSHALEATVSTSSLALAL